LKDSELLDPLSDVADHRYQEEYFYDVSASLSSHNSTLTPLPTTVTVNRSNTPLSSVPEISYPSTQSQVDPLPSELTEIILAQDHYVDVPDAKQDSPDDENMPLYDAESDYSKNLSKEYLLTEPLMKDDNLTSASVNDTSVFKDVTMVYSDTTASSIIHERVDSSSGIVLSNELLTSHLNTANNIVPTTSTIHADEIIVDETYTENRPEISIQKESPATDIKDLTNKTVSQHIETEPGNMINEKADTDFESSPEVNMQNLDTVELTSSLAQSTHTTPEVQEASDTTPAALDVLISESVRKGDPSVSEMKEADKAADKTLAAETVLPVTLISAESLSLDNTVYVPLETQDSKYDIGTEQSNNHVDNKSDSNSRHVDTDKSTAGTLKSVELEYEAPKLDTISVTSTGFDGFGQTLQEDHNIKSLQDQRISVYASAESLSPPEPPSRSSSQGSLRKEGRAGRYHKRPAPTPPPKNPESESEDLAEVRDENSQASIWSKELDEDALSPKDAESAVTARLVLKPGVVKSLGPDSETKAEVFVSRTSQAKHIKSKSKNKQRDSALSRLFVLPKNQFGGLSSYLPFWNGKQEAFTSADTQNGTPGSSDLSSSSALRSSSCSAFVAVHGNTSCGSENNKSRSSSDVNVKELSHSPGQQRRAPLADWE
jgi:hypothetical protein